MLIGKRHFLTLASCLVVGLASYLLTATPAKAAEEGCCYGACMEYCTPEFGFNPCHALCRRDCEAC